MLLLLLLAKNWQRYIKDSDEELGSRLNLKPQQVRAAMAELLSEGLAAKEKMSDQLYSGRTSEYWFIDLRHAVNVILLRVCYMKEMLSQRQEAKAARQASAKKAWRGEGEGRGGKRHLATW